MVGVVTYFFRAPHTKKKRGKGKYKIIKKYWKKIKNNISKKSISERLGNHRKLVEEDQICKIEKI